MKRKMTLLEQELVDKGWVLKCKTYKGRFAKRVDNYIYENEIQGFKIKLFLNAKRTLMDNLTMECHYYSVGLVELVKMNEVFEETNADIKMLVTYTLTLIGAKNE